MNSLVFDFSASNCNGWPWLEAVMDGVSLGTHLITPDNHKIVVELDVISGPHVLEFHRFNKTHDNTRVDSQGHITQDQTVTLENIWYEDVRLPMNYLWKGCFRFDDTDLPSALCWGPNGTWTWPFETPVLDWIINTKNQSRHQAGELFVPTPDRIREFKQQVSRIRNDFNRF